MHSDFPSRRRGPRRATLLAGAAVIALAATAPAGAGDAAAGSSGTPPADPGPRAVADPRGAAVDEFNSSYRGSLSAAPGWNGSAATCTAGSITAAYKAATLQMVNYFRTMSGLRVVTESPATSTRAQAAALMMDAENGLSHDPQPGWACWTSAGAEAAAHSNLSLGNAGPASVISYIEDAGGPLVPHRRWLLYPPLASIGIGATDRAGVIWVIPTNYPTRPARPAFAAWPPSGHVPYQVVFDNWSFAVNAGPGLVDFSEASVTMTQLGASVPLTVLSQSAGYGDDTLVWDPAGIVATAGMADTAIRVVVRNVKVDGASRSYAYDVIIIDPDARVVECNGRAPTINGTAGDDLLVGTSGADVISGGGGNDTIKGLGGNDIICGGPGDDIVRAGDGNDWVHGGTGSNRLSGDTGNDVLRGGGDVDILQGGGGDDIMSGLGGDDRITGGAGDDVARGGAGTDRCDAEINRTCER